MTTTTRPRRRSTRRALPVIRPTYSITAHADGTWLAIDVGRYRSLLCLERVTHGVIQQQALRALRQCLRREAAAHHAATRRPTGRR